MNFSMLVEIFGALVLALHLTGTAFAVHAILLSRTSQGAVAWALSLIFFPYIAVPLYLVFSRQKFFGYVKARRAGDRRIDHVGQAIAAAMTPWKAGFHGDTHRFDVLENLTILFATKGNAQQLLVDGDATFRAIFAAIDAAESYILIQFFIIRDDHLGNELQQRLIQKARAGIRIYFLFDEIGCVRLPKDYSAELRLAGVDMRPFNTRQGWRNRFQINFRNHRKIVIVDGRAAFVGGHNVGDEYLGKSELGRWRDTHVAIRGPGVAALELSFLQDWYWATRVALELPHLRPLEPAPEPAAGAVLALPTGPADEIGTCTLMLLAVITGARERLWITSPYFVPDETVFDALQLAAIRGVDVRILLPVKPDHLLVYLSSFSYLEAGDRVGIKFYRYRAGFLHQKVMLIDDDFSAVGTANLDNRSMRLNFEMTVFFSDPVFTRDVAVMLDRDFADSQRVNLQDLKRRGWPFRFAVRIARLFSPVQ